MTISHVGAATGTTTFTIPTPAIGDMIVVWAFRSATGGVTLPAGWTNIANGNGTSCSFRLAYKIATSTSTASGTWTSATATLCVVYRSSNYATGGTLFRGGSANTHLTTTTITYPAVTMTHADSTSWVAGFAGISVTTDSLSTHAPAGMTFYSGSDLSNTVEVCAYDTNGTVNSWSSTNVTVTNAGNSCSATLEIIENQPGTIVNNVVQHWSFSSDTFGGTLPLDGYSYNINPTLPGNTVVVGVNCNSGKTPVITDNQSNSWPAAGTANAPVIDDGAGNTATTVFVLASAATATSQIKVDLGGNPGGATKVWVTELYNITATVNGTASAAGVAATTGIISGGAFTPTNNNANGGNLILSYLTLGAYLPSANPTLISAETNFTLNDADGGGGFESTGYCPNASQYFLQATSASITPRFYLQGAGAADTYNIISIALSVGTQGTAAPTNNPGGAPWINKALYFSPGGTSNPSLMQIPTIGNCLVFMSFLNGDGVQTAASATDNDGVSWTQYNSGAQTPFVRANVTSTRANRTLSIPIVGTGNLQAVVYDLSNCATAPVVANAHGTLSSGVATSQAHQPDITPTGTNQLTLNFVANTTGPTPSITSPATAVLDTPQASCAKFVAGISSTTLTVSSVTWGALDNGGGCVSGGTVTTGTTITAGSGTSWTVTPSQTVTAGTTMFESYEDNNGLNFGNLIGHYFNANDTSAQNWTVTCANVGGNIQGSAIILAGQPAGAITFMPGGNDVLPFRARLQYDAAAPFPIVPAAAGPAAPPNGWLSADGGPPRHIAITVDQAFFPSSPNPQTFSFGYDDNPVRSRRIIAEQTGLMKPVASALAPSVLWNAPEDNQRSGPRRLFDGASAIVVPVAATVTPSSWGMAPGDVPPPRPPLRTEIGALPEFQTTQQTTPPNGWLSPQDQFIGKKGPLSEAAALPLPPVPTLALLVMPMEFLPIRKLFFDVASLVQGAPPFPSGWLSAGEQILPKHVPPFDAGGMMQPTASAPVSGMAWAGTPGESVVSRPLTWALSSTALSPQVIAPPPAVTLLLRPLVGIGL